MAAKRYFFELRVNFDDEHKKEKEEMLKLAAARMAKGLMSIAVMIADRSPPKINMIMSDSINGDEEVNLNAINTDGPCPTCGHDDRGEDG
jgi:hypothetical protein